MESFHGVTFTLSIVNMNWITKSKIEIKLYFKKYRQLIYLVYHVKNSQSEEARNKSNAIKQITQVCPIINSN